MNGYINPEIFIPLNAVGIDRELGKIQTGLASLGFIEKIFGRSYLQKDRIMDSKSFEKTIFAPYCYLKNNEPINVMPNDNLNSQSFFFVHDPEGLQDEGVLVNTIFSNSLVSLIVWGSLTQMGIESSEVVKIAILRELKKHPEVVLNQVFQNFDRVFDRFTLTDQMINYNKLPYFGLRIDFRIKFSLTPENCE